MERRSFDDAVALCLDRDSRYTREAYFFVRDALDHTVKALGRQRQGSHDRHVRGQELCCGLRDYAIAEFGPLAGLVLSQWGVNETGDIGEIVYALIQAGIFSRSEDDSKDDFFDVFSLTDSLNAPFLPKKPNQPKVSEEAT